MLIATSSCKSKRSKGEITDSQEGPPVIRPSIEGKTISSISFPRKVIRHEGDLDGVAILKRIESVLDEIGVQVTTIRGAGTITSLEIKPFPKAKLVSALEEAGVSNFVTMTEK